MPSRTRPKPAALQPDSCRLKNEREVLQTVLKEAGIVKQGDSEYHVGSFGPNLNENQEVP